MVGSLTEVVLHAESQGPTHEMGSMPANKIVVTISNHSQGKLVQRMCSGCFCLFKLDTL